MKKPSALPEPIEEKELSSPPYLEVLPGGQAAPEIADPVADLTNAKTTKEVHEIMDALVARGILKRTTVNGQIRHSPDNHPAVIAFIQASRRLRAMEKESAKKVTGIREQTRQAVKQPAANLDQPKVPAKTSAKKLKAKRPEKKEESKPAPLSITLSNGKTFASLNEFGEFYDEIKKTDEGQAKLLRGEYNKLLSAKLEKLKQEARSAASRVAVAVKIIRKPENKEGKLGVRDMLQPFVDRGIVILNRKGEYETPSELSAAQVLAEAANKRIHDLQLANEIRNQKINGFEHKDGDSLFVYQIENETDKITDRKKVKVYNVIPIFGNPSLKEGDYVQGVNDPPNFIKLASIELERRFKERDQKKQEEEKRKKEAVRKKEEHKKAAAAHKKAETEALNKAQEVLRQTNGFEYKVGNIHFVYQIKNDFDPISGKEIVVVEKVIPIQGKPILEEGFYTYGEDKIPNFLLRTADKLEQREHQKGIQRIRSQHTHNATPEKDWAEDFADKTMEAMGLDSSTPEEGAEALLEAVKQNPDLKIIKRVLWAFDEKQPEQISPEMTQQELETLIRKWLGIIDPELGDDPSIPTPRNFIDLNEMGISPESLPSLASDLKALIAKAK